MFPRPEIRPLPDNNIHIFSNITIRDSSVRRPICDTDYANLPIYALSAVLVAAGVKFH